MQPDRLTAIRWNSEMNPTSTIKVRTIHPDSARGLTSLRFFAAMYVVLYHSLAPMVASVGRHPSIEKAISLGYVSVSFFFFLSGYILSVAYLSDGRSFPNKALFYSARFARIYPLYILTLILDTPDWFIAHARSYGGYLSAVRPTSIVFGEHVLMLQAWIPWQRGIDRPNWSLSVEAFLYLVFPFAAVFIWKLGSRAVSIFAIALWFGGQLLLMLGSHYFSIDTLMFLPISHLSTFLLGIALARWQVLNVHRVQSWPTWAVSLLLVSAGTETAFFVLCPELVPKQFLNDGLLAPIFAQVILAVSVNGRWPARLFGIRILRELGDASYALYLFHFPILHLAERFHLPHTWIVWGIYLLVCIGVSVLSFRYFETPFRFRVANYLTHGRLRAHG